MGLDRSRELHLVKMAEHEAKVREKEKRDASLVVAGRAEKEDLTLLLDALGLLQ